MDAGAPSGCTPDAGNPCLACVGNGWSEVADGTACPGGSCSSGVCVSASCNVCDGTTGLCAPLAPCTPASPCDDQGTTITTPDPIPSCATRNLNRPYYDDGPPLTWTDPISNDTRAACIYRPDGGAALPLLVFFHGSTATADKVYDHTSLRTKATSASLGPGTAGFVLASMQGRNLHWPDKSNEGGHHDFYYRDLGSPSSNPDFRAVDHLIDTLVANDSIDSRRIYVTGWSNGAFFAQQYAIARSQTPTPGGNRVAAAAVYAGGDPFNNITPTQTPSCQLASYPAPSTPIMLVHRDCDAQVACNTAQNTAFALPPGMDVERWLGQLAGTLGDTSITDLLLDGVGAKVAEATGRAVGGVNCAAVSSCATSTGNANHQHWPDGVEDGSGVDWEPAMLSYLAAHPLP